MENDNIKQDSSIKKKPKYSHNHGGHRERLRNKYLNGGIEVLEDHEVIELILQYAIPRRDTNPLAHGMIKEFGSLHNLLDANPHTISEVCKVSIRTATLISLVGPPIYKKYCQSRWGKRAVIDTSSKASEYVKSLFTDNSIESFYMVCLDIRSRLIASELVSTGTVDEAHIYPREIVSAALKHNAKAVIIAHNHPGESPKPSRNDINATKVIIEALETVNVAVVDHIIVAGNKQFSFAEKRLFNFSY